jgi:hypothetical protein
MGHDMPVPQDADIVLAAVRLGWYVAEVRGRNCPYLPHIPAAAAVDRSGHALPLRAERTDVELRIEAQVVLSALANRLGVNTIDWCWRHYAHAIDGKAKRLAELIGSRDPGVVGGDRGIRSRWDSLAELIYQFDAHIQDVLTARSDSQACGYQLGRALAETYWALDPSIIECPGEKGAAAPAGQGGARAAGPPGQAGGAAALAIPSPDSWHFLLGRERCQEMSRLLGRLSSYMHVYTAPSMAACLQIWRSLAADITAWQRSFSGGSASAWWQAPQNALYLQVRRWYELIILGQDPTTLIKPYMLLRQFRFFRKAAKLFATELALVAASAGALAGLSVVLSQPQVRAWVGAVLGVVAAAGLSAAGISARLKNRAQALFTRLRQDAYTDLIAVAISTCPQAPPGEGRRQRRAVTQALQRSVLTAATPN